MKVFHSISKMTLRLSIILLLINSASRAQYSRAEIDRAVEYLTQKGVLRNLAALTTQDRTKLASRPDVLMACYDIMRAMDHLNDQFATRTNAIDQQVEEIRALATRSGVSTPETARLVDRVMNEVEKKLPTSASTLESRQSIENLQSRQNQIQHDLDELRKSLQAATPDLTNADRLTKATKQNRVIAITSVVVSAVIAVLAAR